MILSMTGYGKASIAHQDKKITVEVKSLNSKAFDLFFFFLRIAPLYREREMEIRNILSKSIERGKVDFSIWIEKENGNDATPINAALVNNYTSKSKLFHRKRVSKSQKIGSHCFCVCLKL